jgi:Tfp pilus assembly protein PilF
VTGLATYLDGLSHTPAGTDYFATSLPAMLLFDDDPQRRRDLMVELLRAQLALLRGDPTTAQRHLDAVLADDPSHELALDLTHRLEPSRSMP